MIQTQYVPNKLMFQNQTQNVSNTKNTNVFKLTNKEFGMVI